MSTNREILMKFITGQVEKVRQDVSMQGYKDDSPYRNNPFNTIYGTPEGTSITMEGVSTPLIGIDEFGNRQEMFPGQEYQYPGSRVIETPMAKRGGTWFGNADMMSVSNKYQQAGTVKKPKLGAGKYYTTTGDIVDWGTPEYERAYNRGEVLSEDGVRSEVTLDGGKLDEVVIKNNYKNGFWENYRDKIIEEGKDSGVLGAIIGVPINAVASLPQLALMNAMTGKVQRPSEAWGFENNEGWFDSPSSFGKNIANFGMDAVTDPADWFGVGELTAAGRLTKAKALSKLKNIPTSIAPELRQGLRTNGLSFDDLPEELQPSLSRIGDSQIGEYIPYQEDDYIKWFNEQKAKMNPPVVKQDPRSILRRSSIIDINDLPDTNFKSEIDWSKWNKEIPDNKALIQEYKTIEQTSKANGSWMKNPDGSAFQGTPEQFVQQNSENFKKAFPNPVLDEAGNIQYNYHGSPNIFNTFDKSKFFSGKFGKGVYTSADKDAILKSYANPDKSRVKKIGEITGTNSQDAHLYELYLNSNNKKVIDDVTDVPYNIKDYGKTLEDYPSRQELYDKYSNQIKENSWIRTDEDFDKFLSYIGEIPREKANLVMPEVDFLRINNTPLKEQITPFSNYPKSTIGNNGMFDMTNPNIYKSILPYVGYTGAGALTYKALQGQEETPEYKQGGLIEYQEAGTVKSTNTSDKNTHTREMAQRVVQLAEERIKNNNYVDVPKEIEDIAKARGESAFSCIGGVCTVLKDAGVMDKVDWSNTHFSENAKEYGFTANQGWGVKGIENLEPGDVLQYNNKVNKQGTYYPGHSQIYLGKDASGQLRFFDNFWGTERTKFEDDVKELLDRSRKKTELSATIYKVNPYDDSNSLGLTPEEKKNYDDKQEFIEKESKSKASYKWSIAPNAKDYSDTTKRVMDKFIEFANDNDKVNDLVKKTGKSKEEIHDSLLNVFGELGVENNWTTSKGKGLGSRLENIAESVLTSVGGGKKLSVGPGQIKYNSIPEDLKEKFNIESPNDLYNLDKVLPLMTAMDLRDKQVLENWGKNNTLSKNLFGWTRQAITDNEGNIISGGFTADQLASDTGTSLLDNGVGRYSPYLRNQYSSIASGTTFEGGNDWIPFNEGTMPNFTEGRFTKSGQDEMRVKYERDTGSYPYKVEQNWRNNLNRFITPNEDGSIELNEVVISRPKKT